MASEYVDRSGGPGHYPSRPIDKEKVEQDLGTSIKKATTPEESAPKAKHVRKAVVYTWDFKSSTSVWNGLRVQPVLSDEVQTFKALIVVHKVLQEGHPIVLKEAQANTGWLESAARTVGSDGVKGYGPLIRAYVALILAKLRFHRTHREFNGLFEYEEYVALKGMHDPNEGYETISDLMALQDQIDNFQKLIFAHFTGGNNECRISALVPQVKESYGIYKFIVNMMRAIHRRIDATDVLEPLRDRFNGQHQKLRRFYYECANLKYLTALINVPKLPANPPSLTSGETDGPDLPMRPATGAPKSPPPRAPSANVDEQAKMLAEFEKKKQEQSRLESEREAEQRRAADMQRRHQEEFEQMQRMQAEREKQAQDELMRQQMMASNSGRVQELERDILGMRGQYERDQMMLEQYDRRVRSLEQEMAGIGQNIHAQLAAKDEMIRSLQEQVQHWRQKYEALAKLYTQLRTEHLDLLSKQKQTALKANSAQESIDRMERMERDMKSKNLELADMIRERDRARFETDRLKSSQKDDLERVRRDLRFAEERAKDAASTKSTEVSGLLGKYNRQLNDLEESLQQKQARIDELLTTLDEKTSEVERVRQEKDEELEIRQMEMDATVSTLANSKTAQGEADEAVNAQIDTLLVDQHKKLNAIIDSILQACTTKVDDALYELESQMSLGNTNATSELALSAIEQAVSSAMEFSSTFSLYLSGDKGGEHVQVIKTANALAQDISEVLADAKGISRLASSDDAGDKITQTAKTPGDAITRLFTSLQSVRLEGSSVANKKEVVVRGGMDARSALQKLSASIEQHIPKSQALSKTAANDDLGDMVEHEMSAAARAIEDATNKLQSMMRRPKDRFSAVDIQVHDTILAAAMAITDAIGKLISASAANQAEIVAEGRGSSSAQAFYKRNNRWTEGLLSAARAVAWATTTLIETADGVIGGHKSLDQLIVSSNEVAAATAQLVQASRVKSSFMSGTQERLEQAAKAVTQACAALVRQVKAITQQQSISKEQQEGLDYAGMGTQEFKIREMEAQVSIVTLERELTDARRKLAEMRRHGYHNDETAT